MGQKFQKNNYRFVENEFYWTVTDLITHVSKRYAPCEMQRVYAELLREKHTLAKTKKNVEQVLKNENRGISKLYSQDVNYCDRLRLEWCRFCNSIKENFGRYIWTPTIHTIIKGRFRVGNESQSLFYYLFSNGYSIITKGGSLYRLIDFQLNGGSTIFDPFYDEYIALFGHIIGIETLLETMLSYTDKIQKYISSKFLTKVYLLKDDTGTYGETGEFNFFVPDESLNLKQRTSITLYGDDYFSHENSFAFNNYDRFFNTWRKIALLIKTLDIEQTKDTVVLFDAVNQKKENVNIIFNKEIPLDDTYSKNHNRSAYFAIDENRRAFIYLADRKGCNRYVYDYFTLPYDNIEYEPDPNYAFYKILKYGNFRKTDDMLFVIMTKVFEWFSKVSA